MEFFCFHRDRAGSGPLRRSMVQQHWAYMDGFHDRLLLRGPTFDEADELTGSVHVIDLPGPAEARAFAFDEPGYQAGAYRDVMLRRWWSVVGAGEQTSGQPAEDLFLVVGFEPEPRPLEAGAVPAADVLCFGHLMDDDGASRLGSAAVVRAQSDRDAALVLAGRSLVGVETHRWTFGGRR